MAHSHCEMSFAECRKTMNLDLYAAFAKPVEYAQVLAVLLNNGTSPTTGAQILKPETVEEMFTNQVSSV